jgi:hypothetical protein
VFANTRLAASLVLLAGSAMAASDETAIQSTFVKPWVEALRSKDKFRLAQFFHPAVRACINAGTKGYFDAALDQEAREATVGPYRVTKIAPMQQPPPTFFPEEDVSYPVRPTYELQVEFEQANLGFTRFLAPVDGSWYEVYPCPTEKGVAYFRALLQERAERQKRTAPLIAALKDPLRGELRDLLRQGRTMDAIHKYQAAASVDLSTAVVVIDALQQSNPRVPENRK